MGYNPGSAGGGGSGGGVGGYGTANQIYLDATFGRDTGKSLSTAFNPANAFLTAQAAFDFIDDNALVGTTLIVRNGSYAGGNLILPFDFTRGNAIVAEGDSAEFTSAINLSGAGFFEARGLIMNPTDEAAVTMTSAAGIIARLHGCRITAVHSSVAVDAYAVEVGALCTCEILGGSVVQCNFLGASGTLTTTAVVLLDGDFATANVIGGRYSVFSQDPENHLAFIHHKGAGSSPRCVLSNIQLAITNTAGIGSACEASILRSIGSGNLEFISSGGSLDVTVNTPSTEVIVPLYLDGAGTIVAKMGSQLVTWNNTPDARVFGAAAAQAGNAATLLASSFMDLTAEATPGIYTTPGVLGSVTVGAHNNLGSLVASALGKGLRLTSPDGGTTQNIGLANGGGVLAFT